MKKFAFLAILISVLIFVIGCKEEENDNPPPAPSLYYTVTYSLSVFGGYDDLQVSYFAPREVRRIKSNPKTPWSESLSDYVKLDSVAINVSILPIANRIVNYEWEVRISKDGDLFDLNSGSASATVGENPEPIYINWRQIIE
jgi:hypothetical protein